MKPCDNLDMDTEFFNLCKVLISDNLSSVEIVILRFVKNCSR